MTLDFNSLQGYRGRAISINPLADELEKQLVTMIGEASSVEKQLLPHLTHSKEPMFEFHGFEDGLDEDVAYRQIRWLGSTLRLYRNLPFGWVTGQLSFAPCGYIKPIRFAIEPATLSYGVTQGKSIGHYQDKKQMWEFAGSIFQDMLEPPFEELFLMTSTERPGTPKDI